MSLEINGLEELQQKLNTIEKNAKSLNGDHVVPVNVLFSKSFMLQHSNVSSLQELFPKFDITSDETIAKVPESELDNLVNSSTDFQSWHEMKAAAIKQYAEKQLFKGI